MSQADRIDSVLQRYHYDALDRVNALRWEQSTTRRFYSGVGLSAELRGERQHSHVRAGGLLLGCREQGEGPASAQLFGTEQNGSVLHVLSDDAPLVLAYTPHGEGADSSLPGFNGEQPDPLTGNYLLGDGYRAYNPTLMRFHSPDSFSPFGGGGLNPYTYCLGDPVNQVDPTGHLSWGAALGIGLGVLGIGLGVVALYFGAASLGAGLTVAGVAAVVGGTLGTAAGATGIAAAALQEKDPDSEAASMLGWVSLGLGAGSAVAGAVSFGAVASKVYDEALYRLFAVYKIGLSGKGASAAGSVWSKPPSTLPGVMGIPHIAERIVRSLPANDLIALADTSVALRNAVNASLRPISQLLATVTTPIALVNQPQVLTNVYYAIATGSVIGTMPAQLTRAGIDPYFIPLPEQNGYALMVPLKEREAVYKAAQVREFTVRINHKYSRR